MTIQRRIMFVWIMFGVLLASTRMSAAAGTEQNTANEVKKGVVAGKIMTKNGEPLSWGQVLFYNVAAGPPPHPEKYYRTPDISRDISGDGSFRAELPSGKYYLGAVKRLSGDRLGVPQAGDYVYRNLDEKGNLKEYVVTPGSMLDLGTMSGAAPVPARDPAKRVITTAIEGVVNDTSGKPVEDAVVIAFIDPSPKGKSLFLSDKTSKDGKYVLPLTDGTYYLRVRNRFSIGPPEPGQIVGFYGDGSLAPVKVKDGEIVKAINFTVILFGGRGPRAEGSAQTGSTQ